MFKSIETHWIALYVNAENVMCFDNFGLEHAIKKLEHSSEIKILQRIFIGNKPLIQ